MAEKYTLLGVMNLNILRISDLGHRKLNLSISRKIIRECAVNFHFDDCGSFYGKNKFH